MNTIPSFLIPGDTIHIIAPAGKIAPDNILMTSQLLSEWGYTVTYGKHLFSEYGRFAGTIEERRSDLQEALDNPDYKLIFCARGGYGVVHLLQSLSLDKFKKSPKWLSGFSDITALHSLMNQSGVCSIHAPMSAHIAQYREDTACSYLKQLLAGNLSQYRIYSHPLNIRGNTEGVLTGGNLAVLAGLRGTPFDIKILPKETILFIEDIGEEPYKIERMMYNLKYGGILEQLSGLIVGNFSDTEEDPFMNKSVFQSIYDLVAEYEYPVCFNFPAGHLQKNYPLILNSRVRMEVEQMTTIIRFL